MILLRGVRLLFYQSKAAFSMGIVTFVTDKAVFMVYRNGNNNK